MKSPKDPRHIARIMSVMHLYHTFFSTDIETTDISLDDLEIGNYSKKIFDGVTAGVKENLAAIDELIDANSEPIKVSDLDKLVLQIIRAAVWEGFLSKSIPPRVAVDEAIELTRDFGLDDKARKVSGILGRIFDAKRDQVIDSKNPTPSTTTLPSAE